MKCAECNKEMENLAILSHLLYLTNPPQYDDIDVCHNCKLIYKKRRHGFPPSLKPKRHQKREFDDALDRLSSLDNYQVIEKPLGDENDE